MFHLHDITAEHPVEENHAHWFHRVLFGASSAVLVITIGWLVFMLGTIDTDSREHDRMFDPLFSMSEHLLDPPTAHGNGMSFFVVNATSSQREQQVLWPVRNGTVLADTVPSTTSEERPMLGDLLFYARLPVATSSRASMVTDGLVHSIALDEVRYGGPKKDSIPAILNPLFVDRSEAEHDLDDESIGIGLVHEGEARFYPLSILVWHQVVNDSINGDPILVTYDPLAGAARAFSRRIGGITYTFGVSGRIWQSNMLLYNQSFGQRGATLWPEVYGGVLDTFAADESLWSQVLGEGVLGKHTGVLLSPINASLVSWGHWKLLHNTTLVLSEETGFYRDYSKNPYGDYAETHTLYYPTDYSDRSLHPKEPMYGIQVGGAYVAYPASKVGFGATTDTVNGTEIKIRRLVSDEVSFYVLHEGGNNEQIPYVPLYWFVWQAIHGDTSVR